MGGERDFSVPTTGGNSSGNIGYGEGGGDVRDQGGRTTGDYIDQQRSNQNPQPQPVDCTPVKATKSPEAGAPAPNANGNSIYLEQQYIYEKSPETQPAFTPVNTGSGGASGGYGGGT